MLSFASYSNDDHRWGFEFALPVPMEPLASNLSPLPGGSLPVINGVTWGPEKNGGK